VSATGSAELGGVEMLGQGERALRRLRGRHVSLLFQDPYTLLNPLMRVGRQVTETLVDERGHRLRGSRRRAEAARRLAEVGIRDPAVANRYPFQLSGGMRQRVGIAAALASDPEILIADEPSTALDVTTQKEILSLLRSIQNARGMGLVLITHDLRVAFSMCDRIYVLYAGSMLEIAPAAELERLPLHPYSLGLLLSEPPLDHRVLELAAVDGTVPAPDDVAGGCPFAPRCAWARPVCTASAVSLEPAGEGRKTACVRIDEIRGELAARRDEAARQALPQQAQTIDRAALVRVDSLHKSFDGHEAVRGVSLDLFAGESIGLVGESGSGKTTLARCLVGLERPTSGSIDVDGIDVSNYETLRSADRRRVRSVVQMIFQDPYSSLNPARSVGASLSEALAVSARGGTIGELLERVGLPRNYAPRKPVALSGGERQRVAIARALAVRPRLLVCDEPVSSLDVSVQAQILNLFRELREELGIGYLFITHDLAVVRQVVDRVYVLYRGEVVESGPVDAVLDRPRNAYTRRLVDSVPRSEPGWLSA
jgi:peptide/nickel transport system ATP-binding protein